MSDSTVDVVIVGAGFSGMYLLRRMRALGFSVRVFERGDDVGGTWYWNRYPGARCDVESMQYSYSFDEALQQEWRWPEKFSAQPDILTYARHVAERFDLRRDITFSTRVVSADFDESTAKWWVTTDDDERIGARFVVMATGCISTAQIPLIPGASEYCGGVYHTGEWPHAPVDFSGQRIAVIGTGSSGIQAIPVLAREAAHVTVFQRTANYSLPARNETMRAEYEGEWKNDYRARRMEMRYTPQGALKDSNDESALNVDETRRQSVFEERWETGGASLLGAFNDLMTNQAANDTAAEFVREKIRSIVKDAKTAEILCPDDHPIGTKRICIDSGYYETFNRDNVELVDIREHAIERLTARGLVAGGREFNFDSIVYATGFDAMTGTLAKIDIRGRAETSLCEKWHAGP
ncbi:MAG: cyclohexanone monooxygenase, partial [Gammaproteobacteria bacterium]|nr:cyclohexanone monooxygenase [Gammaproteobacteria bacterium]